ncbi:synaptobrevin, partial [Tricladium varicosporioides]
IQENIDKVSQRGARLDFLQGKTDELDIQSKGFQQDARKVCKRIFWEYIKSRMCLIGAVFILLLVMV